MKPKEFQEAIEEARVVAAIQVAERRTSGEIRVSVSHHAAPDPVQAAQKLFHRLGMTKTRERNGVLIFVAPRSHTFAMIGDTAIHEKCGQPFWDNVAATMAAHFKNGRFTEGLVDAIERAGALLAEHFPRRGDDQNELSDEIVHS